MAKRKAPQVHTVKTDSGWANKLAGGTVLSNHRKKDTAQAAGRKEAIKRDAEHFIHKVDGTIGEKNSYGNDPHPPKG